MARAAMNDLPRFGVDIRPTVVSPGLSDSSLDGLQEEKAKLENISLEPRSRSARRPKASNGTNVRLNKFVRRLHSMLSAERDGGVVEWRRGLLVLHSIDAFSTEVLPKYFNTRNFKTFRRQLNYYGFLHVKSFAASGDSTTALWVNQELADSGDNSISSVLKLKRVEPNDASKTPEERRERKHSAATSVEVGGLGALLPGKINVPPGSAPPRGPPAPVTPTTEKEVYPNTLYESSDPMIDHAAGLLLSLSHAEA